MSALDKHSELTYPRFLPPSSFSSSMTAACVSYAFASVFALAISMLKTWIVLWSEVAAMKRENLLN